MLAEADFTIVSYSLLKKFRKQLRANMVILDESHCIKNSKAQRSKAVVKLCRDQPNQDIIMLSGTPSSRACDLFNQLRCLAGRDDYFPEFFPLHKPYLAHKHFYFAQRYCNPERVFLGGNRFTYKFRGTTYPDELHAMLSVFAFRRTKEAVLTQLPPKTRTKLVIHEKSKSSFQRLTKQIERLQEERGDSATGKFISEQVRELSKIKATYVVAYLKTVQIDKMLLFAHHRHMLDTLQGYLESAGISFVRVDGRTNMSKRHELVTQFQTQPDVSVALLSIRAAGTGLNLFAADQVVFAEMLWNVKDMLQSEDRAHRIGQHRPVTVTYLTVSNSIDSIVWRSLNSQIKNTTHILDNEKGKYLI
jgi:SWI/SNF-related matrix-associated actin-dependent regulator 1 of chromatin subfamily A